MKLRGLLTLAMALQAMVTAVALLASCVMTGAADPHAFGTAQLLALLASGIAAVLLALICAHLISKSLAKLPAAHEAELRRALADGERKTQAVIRTALDAFVQTNDDGVVIEWSPQAEALTGWARAEAIGTDIVGLVVPEPLRAAFRHRMKGRLPEMSATPIGSASKL